MYLRGLNSILYLDIIGELSREVKYGVEEDQNGGIDQIVSYQIHLTSETMRTWSVLWEGKEYAKTF